MKKNQAACCFAVGGIPACRKTLRYRMNFNESKSAVAGNNTNNTEKRRAQRHARGLCALRFSVLQEHSANRIVLGVLNFVRGGARVRHPDATLDPPYCPKNNGRMCRSYKFSVTFSRDHRRRAVQRGEEPWAHLGRHLVAHVQQLAAGADCTRHRPDRDATRRRRPPVPRVDRLRRGQRGRGRCR